MSVEQQAATFPVARTAALDLQSKMDRADDGTALRWALILFAIYSFLIGASVYWLDAMVPDRLGVTFLGTSYSVGNVHQHIIDAGILGFVLAPVAFMIELLATGWNDSSLRHLLLERSPSSRSDLVVFILWQTHVMNGIRTLFTFGIALISGLWIHRLLLSATGIDLGFSWLPAPLAFLAYVLVFTFLDYWTHRLDHTRYFWPIHRYHHSAEEFFVITSDRGNPAAFSTAFATTIPLGILGMSPTTGFWIYILVGAQHLIIHSRIDSDFGWVGHYLLQSPVHHRLHHIRDMSLPTAHFSLLPVWDHLFGTWRGGGSQQVVIGVEHPYRHGFWVFPDLLRDYKDFLHGFLRRRET